LKRVYIFGITALCVLGFACSSSQYRQAVAFREAGKHEEGIAYFREKMKTESGALALFDVHRLILQYHDTLNRLDEGIALYKGFQDFALTHYIKGLQCQYEGMHAQAVSNFKLTLEKRPNEYAVWYDLAVSCMRLGPRFYREARGALARACKLKSDFAPALHDMGLMLGYGWGTPATGMAWMRDAVGAYFPVEKESILDAKITLARFAEQSGEYKRALEVYRSMDEASFAKAIRAGDPGEAYFRTGDKARALSAWQKALDILGYQSPRGRHFFKQLYGSRQGAVDFTGVKYKYCTVESLDEQTPRYIFAAEVEPYYDTNQGIPFAIIKRDGLDDTQYGYETWNVEYLGVTTHPVPVRRLIQNRGVAKSLQTRDGLRVFVSLQKTKFPVMLPDGNHHGKQKSVNFWRETNPIAAIYSGETQLARISLPFAHFHDLVMQDVDGDGREDIVSCGFDAAGNLMLDIRLRAADGWRLFAQQTCDLANPENGFMLLDLDGAPGLELVAFSSPISWADVYQRGAAGFAKNHQIFPNFARDFAWRYSFLDQQEINKRMYSGWRSPEEKAALPLLLQYRYTAESILGSLPQ